MVEKNSSNGDKGEDTGQYRRHYGGRHGKTIPAVNVINPVSLGVKQELYGFTRKGMLTPACLICLLTMVVARFVTNVLNAVLWIKRADRKPNVWGLRFLIRQPVLRGSEKSA